jgi:predicted glutamine amidotransferase
MQLNAVANSVAMPAEFRKTLEGLDEIERGCQAQKYQNTSNIHVETMKLLLKVSGMLGANNEMRQKVDEFTSYIEKLMENYDLMNKEIFTVQANPLVKQGSDLMKKAKDMDKIRKDIDQYKKKNANLQKSLSGKFVGQQIASSTMQNQQPWNAK